MDLDSLLVRGAQGVVLVRGSYLIQRGEVQCIVQLPPNKRESVSRAAAASQFLNSTNSCLLLKLLYGWQTSCHLDSTFKTNHTAQL